MLELAKIGLSGNLPSAMESEANDRYFFSHGKMYLPANEPHHKMCDFK